MDVNIYRNNYKDLVYMNVCLINIGFLVSFKRNVLKELIKFFEKKLYDKRIVSLFIGCYFFICLLVY